MARANRIDYPGARHHAMNRGARRSDLFTTDEACAGFVHVLAQLPERFGVRVHGYALMPNHFHVMLESVQGNLSRAMQHLSASTTRMLNASAGWDGPVFRGRFRNRLVQDDAYWSHLLLYLHLNPVRAHLAENVDKSRWNSHGAYAGLESTPEWLTTSELLGAFGGSDAYRAACSELRRKSRVAPASFDETRLWQGSKTGSEPPPPSEPRGFISVDAALARLEVVTGAGLAAVQSVPRGRRGGHARWVAAWWLVRAAGCQQNEVARMLGIDTATVSRMLKRVRREGPTDERLRPWVSALLESEEWVDREVAPKKDQ